MRVSVTLKPDVCNRFVWHLQPTHPGDASACRSKVGPASGAKIVRTRSFQFRRRSREKQLQFIQGIELVQTFAARIFTLQHRLPDAINGQSIKVGQLILALR